MTELAEKAVTMVERRLSRRGFLATCGKLTLGLGMAVLGVAGTSRSVMAACCPPPTCDTHTHPCPPSGCPSICTRLDSSQCCDASNYWHICWKCLCSGITCYCEEPTVDPC